MRKTTRTLNKATKNVIRAGRNFGQTAKLAVAASQVVAARTGMAATGMLAPQKMDVDEFSRILPEKMTAFYAAGIAFVQQATRIAAQLSVDFTDEMAASGKCALGVASSRSPAALAWTYNNSCRSWWARRISQSLAFGNSAMRAQAAVVAPIQSVAHANQRRLVRA